MSLMAISPIDGRYASKVSYLSNYLSEYALFKYRVQVEIEYLIALSESGLEQLTRFDSKTQTILRNIYQDFSIEEAERVKQIEKEINHDVKAVEYFIKEKVKGTQIEKYSEFIHFGLTSQDINNTAIPLLLKQVQINVYMPSILQLVKQLREQTDKWKYIPLLARTHGQPASPTTLGKEWMVYVERLEIQLDQLKSIPFSAKFGGATGNFNAHKVTFPSHNWIDFANRLVHDVLGLKRSLYTTQIEHYDNLAALFDCYKRINTILIDFSRDVWTYISMDYFKQKVNENEVGSSAMPHKVNPIDFENAEGNLGIANALFMHLSAKLPISRLQRDLTDSTVLRNIGVPIAHTLISFQSISKGLNKLLLNEKEIQMDLDKNWMVVAEGIQNILRREGYPKPYEALKTLTRTNKQIDAQTIADFINKLDISEAVKVELRSIHPQNYIGYTLQD